ncbi:MAG: M15 family metallopeptidase [Thermostichales cyanobacterium SZTDM-1c_bins_54]
MDDIPVAQRQHPQPTTPRDPWPGWWRLGLGLGLVVLLILGVVMRQGPSPVVASVAPSPLPVSPSPLPASASNLLGHRPFAEAPADQLETIGSYQGRAVQLRRSAAQAWRSMQQAAAQAGVVLVPISGFRSIADQEYLFFQRARQKSLRPQERALVSAPPGYSEHHTGYALDIGDGRDPATDVEVTFTRTAAWAWLNQHGARFGFELSFPEGNSQGISFEPWHWRYVGDRHSLETFYGQPSPRLSE